MLTGPLQKFAVNVFSAYPKVEDDPVLKCSARQAFRKKPKRPPVILNLVCPARLRTKDLLVPFRNRPSFLIGRRLFVDPVLEHPSETIPASA